MLSRARRGVCEIVAGAALWRCRCRSRGRRSILCIWVCVCVAGVAFGSCLEGQDAVARAAGGVRNRGRRSTLAMPFRNRGRRSTLAMPLPKSWQAQHSVHLGVCLCGRGRVRQLSRGTGCCRARGGGCAKSWQAQHDAVAKSWQAQHFGDAVAEVVAGAAFCASGCVFVWQGSHSAAVERDRMLSRVRRGVCEIVAGAALWRCRCEIVAGAALWRCRCRSCGKRSVLCIWVCVCVAGVAFGSCLEGQDVVARARRGVCEIVAGAALWRCRCEIVAGAALWRCRCEIVAGAAFCASGCVFVWQGSHSAAVLRDRMLSRARRGVCEIVAGAALWRCRCEIVAGAALWRCRCRSRGRRCILCIWVLCNRIHTRGARYMCMCVDI